MASRSRLIRALSPPEPVTPPPVNKRKYMGTKAFANLALSYVDEEEEVLLPIRRTPPPKSPTPSVTSDEGDEDYEDRPPTAPLASRARLAENCRPFDNPDWSDPDMSPSPRFKLPTDMTPLHKPYPYPHPHPQIDINQIMSFGSIPPEARTKKPKKGKSQAFENEDGNKTVRGLAVGGSIAPLPSRGQGFGVKSSAEKYSERVKGMREAGRSPVSEEPDRVRYEFPSSATLPRINYRQLRGPEEARKLGENYGGKGEGKGGVKEGRVSKRKLVRDKDKPKRKYTFKNGKPTNPRKQGEDWNVKAKGQAN